MKKIGWLISGIGGLITFINAQTYLTKSSGIHPWYYNRTELESARTFLIVGIAVLVIGIAVLMTGYLKNERK